MVVTANYRGKPVLVWVRTGRTTDARVVVVGKQGDGCEELTDVGSYGLVGKGGGIVIASLQDPKVVVSCGDATEEERDMVEGRYLQWMAVRRARTEGTAEAKRARRGYANDLGHRYESGETWGMGQRQAYAICDGCVHTGLSMTGTAAQEASGLAFRNSFCKEQGMGANEALISDSALDGREGIRAQLLGWVEPKASELVRQGRVEINKREETEGTSTRRRRSKRTAAAAAGTRITVLAGIDMSLGIYQGGRGVGPGEP